MVSFESVVQTLLACVNSIIVRSCTDVSSIGRAYQSSFFIDTWNTNLPVAKKWQSCHSQLADALQLFWVINQLDEKLSVHRSPPLVRTAKHKSVGWKDKTKCILRWSVVHRTTWLYVHFLGQSVYVLNELRSHPFHTTMKHKSVGWKCHIKYHLQVAAGYRRFAAGVDRATAAYNRVKQRLKWGCCSCGWPCCKCCKQRVPAPLTAHSRLQ